MIAWYHELSWLNEILFCYNPRIVENPTIYYPFYNRTIYYRKTSLRNCEKVKNYRMFIFLLTWTNRYGMYQEIVIVLITEQIIKMCVGSILSQ